MARSSSTPTTNAYGNVNVSATTGSLFGATLFNRGTVATTFFLSFLDSSAADLTGAHSLTLNLSGAGLTDAGGTVSLPFGLETTCLNSTCQVTSTTERFLNTGATLTAAAPEPATLPLIPAGVLALFGAEPAQTMVVLDAFL